MTRFCQAYTDIEQDYEDYLQGRIEDELLEDVRWWVARIRDMGPYHDGFFDAQDPVTGQWFVDGCDCNQWNRHQLKLTIKKLRAWRKGVYESV